MKVLKTMMAGLLALSAASLADAQTVIHISGSTAFRGSAHTAIRNILAPGFTYAYTGTSFTGANQAIFTGTTITNSNVTVGIPVIIKTFWTGSEGGVQTVSQQLPLTGYLTNTTTQSTSGTASAPSVFDPATVPEVCMADAFQASSAFPTPHLTEQTVGIVPFKWVASPDMPANATNLTPQLAQALWVNGSLALSLFTGVTNDETNKIFSTGRDADSGTRLTALAESGVGQFTTIVQYVPTNSSGSIIDRTHAGPVAGQEPYPAETINGIFYDVGLGGYNSGGDLAVAMELTNTLATIGGYYVTYLGLSDSVTALGGGAKEMTWNGVSYSPTAVQEGKYTFWGYEHLDYRNNYGTADANGKKVADLLAGQIKAADATVSGLLIPSMHVVRSIDGGLVTPNF